MTTPQSQHNPPDRGAIATEQRNPRSMRLHAMSVADCVTLMTDEDAFVIDALCRARPALVAFIEALVPRFAAGGRLIYLGAGTSGRLGVLDSSEAPPTFQLEPGRIIGLIAGGDSALRRSSEGAEDNPDGARPDLAALSLTNNDTILGIAAGGTTPYVLGAFSITRELAPRALTALLVCTPIPKPADVDHLILIDTGPEILTGSTRLKAGTATKLALNTISTTLMVRTGRVYENLMVDLRAASNNKLRDRAARIISTLTSLPRNDSLRLLDDAAGSVKTAILMHRLKLDRATAESRLAAHAGRLDVALNEPPGADHERD